MSERAGDSLVGAIESVCESRTYASSDPATEHAH
jgi:hypothetical protein